MMKPRVHSHSRQFIKLETTFALNLLLNLFCTEILRVRALIVCKLIGTGKSAHSAYYRSYNVMMLMCNFSMRTNQYYI